jgi:exodeoxyribonuclease III
MKIVSLNINGARDPACLWLWLEAQGADIMVLTEFRLNPSGNILMDCVEEFGWHHHATFGGTHNGVLVLSRTPFEAQVETPPGAPAGALMLCNFKSFALLACYFPQREAKKPFFAAVHGVAESYAAGPLLILGDLNVGNNCRDKSELGANFHLAETFDALSTDHDLSDLYRLTHGDDARDYSWISSALNGFRIDHALANQAWLDMHEIVFCYYDHAPRSELKLTDHSALILA